MSVGENGASNARWMLDDYSDHLPYVLMVCRTVHSTAGCTPNLLMFGREVNIPAAVELRTPVEHQIPECPIVYAEW